MIRFSRFVSSIFEAEIKTLPLMLRWVRIQMQQESLSDQDLTRMEVAIEEALVNIIHYAYLDKEGKIELTCRFCFNEFIELVIKDHGIPFNPLKAHKEVDKETELHERKEGGLGIAFINQLMDEIRYERREGANILTLRKIHSGSSEPGSSPH